MIHDAFHERNSVTGTNQSAGDNAEISRKVGEHIDSASEIAEALHWISPDTGRHDWVCVLMAIKSAMGDGGREIAEVWSQGSDRYSAQSFRDTWRSIREEGGITAASLFRMARDGGYRPNGTAPQRPRKAAPQPQQRAESDRSTLWYAIEIWKRARREDRDIASHPYAIRKGITHAAGAGRVTASGRVIGRNADCVVIPLRTLDGELVGVECINAAGQKQTFGRKGVLVLGNDVAPSLPQLVCEGWACGVGLLLQYSGNIAVYCAFGKSNLDAVAQQVEARHPARRIVICWEQDA